MIHPQPRQIAALKCPVEDLAYGGARGGGKTFFLILDFAAQAGKYGKHAHGLILRRKQTELVEVIRAGKDILLPLGWTWTDSPRLEFRSPDGAVLRLRHLDNDADAEDYQGHQYTYIGIDEATNFPSPEPIDKLWGTLRSAHGVPCVRRLTCNPGGAGHLWIKKRYRPDLPFQVRDFVPNEDRPDLKIKCVFIPSRLEDNQALMKADPTYEARLAASGSEALFQAWRFGNWDVISGAYFDVFNENRHVIQASRVEIEPWWPVWISGDWGFKDFTAIHWHAMREDRTIVTFRELYVNQRTPEEIADLIVAMNGHFKPSFFFFSHEAFARRTSPRTIADEIGEKLAMASLPWPAKADTDRVGGWSLMYQLLKTGQWEISDACPRLIESIPLLQRDEKKVEDIAESPYDHAPDSARYGLKTYLAPRSKPETAKLDERLEKVKDPTAYAMLAERLDYERRKADRPLRLRRYAA